jgi:probable F420-dependent oxidoreductase
VSRLKVGVQLEPQHCSFAEIRQAWREADALGVDSIFTWDHFFPLWGGDPNGAHFEGWVALAAAACDTERAMLGVLVSSVGYRSPDLLADIARTTDHISAGRVILGIGAGWNERDYEEYGFQFGTVTSRLRELELALPRLKARLSTLNPPPVGPMPILIGGEGERVTLRLVAQYADIWNGFGPVETFIHKSRVLDGWCQRVDRDPSTVERSVLLRDDDDLDRIAEYASAGAQHLIFPVGSPFDLKPIERLLGIARSIDGGRTDG